MINTLEIFEELKGSIGSEAAKKVANVIGKVYEELRNTVTKEEFNELRDVVKELAQAQKRTEERLTRLEDVVEELAEAQRRTEQRVEELAEAQKRTEMELRKLVGGHRKTRENLGGLQHTVGYILEDRAYAGLPELLVKDFGISLVEPLRRDYIEVFPGKYLEVNIIGCGERDGEKVWIIGECKSQIKKKDVDEFIKNLKQLDSFLPGEKISIIVTYQAPPAVREYIESKGLKVYFSYQFPL